MNAQSSTTFTQQSNIETQIHSRRFARDERWSETGDRYIVKLFRDFVFHSVDEHGNPVVNLGHVLTHLNKVSVFQE